MEMEGLQILKSQEQQQVDNLARQSDRAFDERSRLADGHPDLTGDFTDGNGWHQVIGEHRHGPSAGQWDRHLVTRNACEM